MLYLGFKPTIQRKGYYTDGHNKADVVAYRDNVFLPQMLAIERRMRVYSGENMDIETMSVLEEGEKEAVFICYDESTFYCCEGQ
jgi:sporulation-control protein spo0M